MYNFHFRMVDLTANALIELFKAGKEPTVTFSQLDNYAEAVINELHEKGEDAVFLLSRDNTSEMLHSYNRWFKETEKGIELEANVRLNDLIDVFRGFLPWSAIEAFASANAVSALTASK